MHARVARVVLTVGALMVGLATGSTAVARPALPAAPGAGQSYVTVLRSDATAIDVQFDLPRYALRRATAAGVAYVAIDAPGMASLGRPGYPDLPIAATLLGIPPSGEPRVDVTLDEAATLSGRWRVVPAPQPSYDAHHPVDPLVRREDPHAYARAAAFPETVVAVTEVAWMRGQRVLRLEFRPFQVHTATGELEGHRRLRARIRFDADPGALTTARRPVLAAPGRDDAFEPVLRGVLVNYETARAWRVDRGPVPTGVRLAAAPGAADDQARWNIQVDADGMYRVTGQDLARAGMVLGDVNPRDLRLFAGGREVAVWLSGAEDARLDPGDAVVFHGEGARSKYTGVNVYQLAVGADRGLRMAARDGRPGGVDALTTYQDTVRGETNARYVSDKPRVPLGDQDPPGFDRFYWEQLSAPGELTHTVATPDAVAGGGPARLRVEVVGKSDLPGAGADHRLVARVDGDAVGEVTWDGDAGVRIFTFPVDTARLTDGQAVVRIEAPGGMPGVVYDQFYVDRIVLEYPRPLAAHGDGLAFAVDRPGDVEVSGFSGADVAVFDVTDPAAPVRVEQLSATTGNGGTTVRFRHAGPDPGRYDLRGAGGYRAPLAIVARPAPRVRSMDLAAEYVIVAPGDLLPAIEALAAHRATGARHVAAVDVQRVYDGFGGGVADPAAIRAFLAFAYHSWADRPPTTVLLVGDGSYDPRRYLADSRPTLLPAYLTVSDPWLGEVASDNAYVTVSGDDELPDLFVGRMTAGSPGQAKDMVDKVLAYELAPPPGDWDRNLLFVADDPDAAGDFHALSDDVVTTHVPGGYQVDRVYHGQTSTDRAVTRAAILEALNPGRLFVQYVGHGRTTSWGAENLLRRSDVLALANGGRLPVLLDMTCLTGYFNDPVVDSISETMVAMPAGGAIAAFSPTGFGVATGHDVMNRAFVDGLLRDGISPLGAVAALAKATLFATTTVGRDLLDTFVLLGDPGIEVRLPFHPTPSATPTPAFTPTVPATATVTGAPSPSATDDRPPSPGVTPTGSVTPTHAPVPTTSTATDPTETLVGTRPPATSATSTGTPTALTTALASPGLAARPVYLPFAVGERRP
jgi:hypothetical protein